MFDYHTPETAPEKSLPLLELSQKNYGFHPMLHRVLAEAPISYEAYLETFRLFTEESSLSPTEQQVVMMTANVTNDCHYCTAGHTMLMTMMKMPQDVIDALRAGRPLSSAKLEALRQFTLQLLEKRGHVGDDALQTFLAAGYTKAQALEVLTGLASKLISNFTNALAHTVLDAPVKPYAWSPEKAA